MIYFETLTPGFEGKRKWPPNLQNKVLNYESDATLPSVIGFLFLSETGSDTSPANV